MMKVYLRLNSGIPDGVGGPDASFLELMYGYLLAEAGQTRYGTISINQIGADLNEFIEKRGRSGIHINIRYPVTANLSARPFDEQYLIRLEVIHGAILKIAAHESKLDVQRLIAIRKQIIDNNFQFVIPLKKYTPLKAKRQMKLLVKPSRRSFEYLLSAQEEGQPEHQILLYTGLPETYYSGYFFKQLKRLNTDTVVISGSDKDVELHVSLKSSRVQVVNKTTYPHPARFQMFRADISEQERKAAENDWMHAMPPEIAEVIRNSHIG